MGDQSRRVDKKSMNTQSNRGMSGVFLTRWRSKREQARLVGDCRQEDMMKMERKLRRKKRGWI